MMKPKRYPYNEKKKSIKIEKQKTLRETIIDKFNADYNRLSYNPKLIERKNGKVFEWKD